jgi:hypothetical protein
MLERGYSAIRSTANTFHPDLVRSNLPAGLPWYLRLPGTLAMRALGKECPTGVFLASSPDVAATTGAIFVGRKHQSFAVPWDTREEARRLWDASEALVGRAV